jgi:hypothetical protein
MAPVQTTGSSTQMPASAGSCRAAAPAEVASVRGGASAGLVPRSVFSTPADDDKDGDAARDAGASAQERPLRQRYGGRDVEAGRGTRGRAEGSSGALCAALATYYVVLHCVMLRYVYACVLCRGHAPF